MVLRYFLAAHPEASKLSPQEWGMDTRTTMRELDEVIARVQSAAERETALLDVLAECSLRRRKLVQQRTMRAHVHRLRRLRGAVSPGKTAWSSDELIRRGV
jgi:hypothetical protein